MIDRDGDTWKAVLAFARAEQDAVVKKMLKPGMTLEETEGHRGRWAAFQQVIDLGRDQPTIKDAPQMLGDPGIGND